MEGLRERIRELERENQELKDKLREFTYKSVDGFKIPAWIRSETIGYAGIEDFPYYALDNTGQTQYLQTSTGKWMRRARAIYINYHGLIPDDFCVYFADGDSSNTEENNIKAIPKEEYKKMLADLNKKMVNR